MDLEHTAMTRLQETSRMSMEFYGKPLLVTTSGGKDSSVCLTLAQRAGIPYEVLHNHTTVDAPETVYFVRSEFKHLEEKGIKCDISYPVYKGAPVSMWTPIPQKLMPPTRLMRYCSDVLKEHNGRRRFVVTGMRCAESSRRRNSRGIFEAISNNIKNKIVLTGSKDDNWERFRTAGPRVKRMCNPIIDWEDSDVWSYIRAEKIPVNPLYAYGFHRVGCIGCPMASANRWKEFGRYPQYLRLYLRAFDWMIAERKRRGLPTMWADGEECFHWWMEDGVLPGQMSFDDLEETV